MKKAIKRIIIVLAVITVLAAAAMIPITITKSWVATVTWDDPKLDNLADGDYPGEAVLSLPPGAAAANPAVKVVVHVKDHRYTGFEIVSPAPLAETLKPLGDLVVAQQTLKPGVDAVSGGTVSKIAFLSAVANAVSTK
jgi:uncharacterized protein with FMN-binding domain